ncbi:YncE family protein [Mycolicibacterium brumae]|nr:YncE family protein [Mycolicibacterium brumae]MCV7191977.1 YncE family protein [Mycolicibacterium brumae]UWW07743.1 YncE family protein [Mycolicibacterium brumae]
MANKVFDLNALPVAGWLRALPGAAPAADASKPQIAVGRGPIADMALDPYTGQLYVTNPTDNSLAVIDTDTLTVTQVITDLAEAHSVVAAGGNAYVSTVTEDGDTVSVLDTALYAGGEVATDVFGVGEAVRDLALSPEGERVYAARSGAGIAVVDIITGSVSTIAVPGAAEASAEAIAVSLDGRKAYLVTADYNGGQLIAVDTVYQRVVGVRALPTQPHAVSISRDGSTLLVARCDPQAGTDLDIIDAASLHVMETVAVAGLVTDMVFSVAGERIYLVAGGRVKVLDASTMQTIETFTGVAAPSCIAESADGSMLYVADYDGNVSTLSVGEVTDELLAQMMSTDIINVPVLELARA